MGQIATTDARAVFTKALVDVYKERPMVMNFLRSFFPSKEYTTKEVSIEVQRGFEKIAADVYRNTEGNRNDFGKSTEKIFIPPYFREYFDCTQLDLYERAMGSTTIDSGVFAQLLEDTVNALGSLQDKIERSYELQCASVLQTGVVTLNSGTDIDFKRKTASMVTLSGAYWTSDSVNPYTSIGTGCKFIREKGKAQGSFINAIFGAEALAAFLDNAKVKERADIRNYSLDTVSAPQRNSVGASFHGQVSVDSYNVRIWSYPEIYTNSSNEAVPYIDPKKVILLPESPRFRMAFAGIPQLITPGAAPRRGAYIISEFTDERKASHIYDIQSAGIAIPVAVDQIYTIKAVA